MPHEIPSKWSLRLGLLVVCALLVACKIVIIAGPTSVSIGAAVTYVLEVSSESGGGNVDLFVVAEVPVGWQLQSSTYQGIVVGAPVSGTGMVVASSICNSVLGTIRAGYQRLHIQNDMVLGGFGPSDVGQVTLEFMVESQPTGEFNIYFVFGNANECSEPAVATINRQGIHFLTLVQSLFDGAGGVDGVAGPGEMAPSPDGRHLYVAGGADKSVAAFAREEASGLLTFIEAETHGVGAVDGLGMPVGIAISHDGAHLYVASLSDSVAGDQGGVAIFDRDPATGSLTFYKRLLEDVASLALSPDDQHLYASDGGITAYSRDPATGDLTFVQSLFPGGRLMASPDGRHLYVVEGFGGQVAAYERDELSGLLTWLGLSVPAGGAALSPDGRHLYATAGLDPVLVFARDETTGLLSIVGTFSDLVGEGFGISPESVAVSPDGRYVVVGGRGAVVAFERNQATGEIARIDTLYSGNLPVRELEGQRALTFAPSSPHLYATSLSDDALLVFDTSLISIFQDGFESGTTSAWSSTVP